MISNAQSTAALIGAAIIALGFFPVSLSDPSLPKATWFELSIAVLPLAPFVILLLSFMTDLRVPVVFAAGLSLMILGTGALLTIIMMALAGGGTEMVLLHGAALTLVSATSILLVSSIGKKANLVVLSLYIVPVLVGVWSVAMVPLAYSSAVEISLNRPFCIGAHGPTVNELDRVIGLRGLSFYTTRSGYKIGDSWYFHGLLLVQDEEEIMVFNWSPRNMEFQLVGQPSLLLASPFEACAPRIKFLQQLDTF